MWVRLVTMLICVVFLINGCNSLISQFFGTHKLRTFSAEQAVNEGIGDSDYIELTGMWRTGDYIVIPPRNDVDKAVLIFPLLTDDQVKTIEAGEQVEISTIGWTKNFSMECDQDNSCAPQEQLDARGVVREMRPEKKKAHMLDTNKYRLAENVTYVEVGRAPLAWYWNLLMVLGSLGLAFFMEARANRERLAAQE